MKLMSFHFRISCLVVLLLFDNVIGSSFYQIRGLGRINYFNQADAMGRGNTAIAIDDIISINSINPAALSFVNITRISGEFYHEDVTLKTVTTDGISHFSNLNGAKLLVPVSTNKLVVSLGIKPFSMNNLRAESEGELSTGNKYIREIVNSGGLNQFTLGIGTSFNNRVFTGLFIHYNFGRVVENWKVDFVSDLFKDTSDKIVSTIWGWNLTAGVMTKVTPKLTIGALYSTASNLSVNNRIDYTFGSSSEITSVDMKIPHTFGIGASYLLVEKVRFSCDYFSQLWHHFEINNKSINNYNNSHHIFSGVELLPAKKITNNYFKKVVYRAGFQFSRLPYQDTQGNDLGEYMGTFGFGLPFYENIGRIDIGMGVGKRGSLNKNLLEESFFRLMISITGGERWFVRPR